MRGLKGPDGNQAGGSKDPHVPPAMERERIASRRQTEVTLANKRKTNGTEGAFDANATHFRWHATMYSHKCQCQEVVAY